MKDDAGRANGCDWSPQCFGPFVYKAVRVGGMLHQQGSCMVCSSNLARYVIVLFQEGFERGNAFFGMPAISSGKSMMRRHFFQAETSQEEGFAWSGCNPVGVGCACVQHGTGGFLWALDSSAMSIGRVLQFERTDRFHFSKVLYP